MRSFRRLDPPPSGLPSERDRIPDGAKAPARTTLSGVELVEVVDERGAVTGVVPRPQMRARNLRHRAVAIVVRDDGRVLVHRRAEWKDVYPGRWDVAFGGVPNVGEDWRDAAVRELAEEAGLRVRPGDLAELGGGRWEDDDVRVVTRVFAVESAGPFVFVDEEVVAIEWVALDELDAWLSGHDVVTDSRAIVVPLLSPDGRDPRAPG